MRHFIVIFALTLLLQSQTTISVANDDISVAEILHHAKTLVLTEKEVELSRLGEIVSAQYYYLEDAAAVRKTLIEWHDALKKMSEEYGKGMTSSTLIFWALKTGNKDIADALCIEATKTADSLSNKIEAIRLYNSLSRVFYESGDQQTAEMYHDEAIRVAEAVSGNKKVEYLSWALEPEKLALDSEWQMTVINPKTGLRYPDDDWAALKHPENAKPLVMPLRDGLRYVPDEIMLSDRLFRDTPPTDRELKAVRKILDIMKPYTEKTEQGERLLKIAAKACTTFGMIDQSLDIQKEIPFESLVKYPHESPFFFLLGYLAYCNNPEKHADYLPQLQETLLKIKALPNKRTNQPFEYRNRDANGEYALLAYLLRLMIRLNQYDEAQKYADQFQVSWTDQFIQLDQAIQFARLGKCDDAMKLALDAKLPLLEPPQNPSVDSNSGMRIGVDNEKLARAYQRTYAERRQQWAYGELAVIFARQERLDHALQMIEAIDPNAYTFDPMGHQRDRVKPEIVSRAALVLLDQGNFAMAKSILQVTIEEKPVPGMMGGMGKRYYTTNTIGPATLLPRLDEKSPHRFEAIDFLLDLSLREVMALDAEKEAQVKLLGIVNAIKNYKRYDKTPPQELILPLFHEAVLISNNLVMAPPEQMTCFMYKCDVVNAFDGFVERPILENRTTEIKQILENEERETYMAPCWRQMASLERLLGRNEIAEMYDSKADTESGKYDPYDLLQENLSTVLNRRNTERRGENVLNWYVITLCGHDRLDEALTAAKHIKEDEGALGTLAIAASKAGRIDDIVEIIRAVALKKQNDDQKNQTFANVSYRLGDAGRQNDALIVAKHVRPNQRYYVIMHMAKQQAHREILKITF